MIRDVLSSAAAVPDIQDPLPIYSRQDPETISVRSSAPSYVSEAPSYHSSFFPTPQQSATTPRPGLQPPAYAPDTNRVHSHSVGDISNHRFNINQWSAATNGPRARHYENVAKRRATLAYVEDEERLNTMAKNLVPLINSSILDLKVGVTNANRQSETGAASGNEDAAHLSPHEDPDLVGIDAAAFARERRLYIERCENEAESLKQENMAWDFMLNQMADWKERERSWDRFRAQVRKRHIWGGRLARS